MPSKKLTIVIKGEKGDVSIELDPHEFKSGSSGWYFRDRVDINGSNYHCQVVISKK